jgi:hypothetical protein
MVPQMPDTRQDRLIQSAVRPFSDNVELRHAASDFLEKINTADAEAAEAMAARWDEADAGKQKSLGSVGLWAGLAAISTAVLITDLREISRFVELGQWSMGFNLLNPDFPEGPQSRITARLSNREKLLLFGDLSKEKQVERKEALWRSDLENPAYFLEYAGAYIGEHDKLPPDYLETARRIDPNNAWFTYLAVGIEAREAVKKVRRKSRRVDGKIIYEAPQTWEILDPARLDHALALFREAAGQSEFNDYSAKMLRKRLLLLPQESLLDQLDSSLSLGHCSVFPSLQLRHLGDAVAAGAWNLGEAGDVAGFQQLVRDGDHFLRRFCGSETGTLLDGLVKNVVAFHAAGSFAAAAETLGLEKEAARWKEISDRLNARSQSRDTREFLVDGKPVQRGMITGMFGSTVEMVARQSATQVPVSAADLKPLRLLDHELLSWVFSYVTWLAMALCLGCVVSYRFRVAPLPRRLAGRMERLLRQADWAWMIGAGALGPFIFVMTINRFTPLGGRDFSTQGTALLMPAGHFLGLWILWWVMPVQLFRWRMAKRAGGFGFSGTSWVGWVAIGCALAFVPVIGWAAISGPHEATGIPRPFRLALTLASVPLVWLLVQVARTLPGRAEHPLYRASSSLALAKVYAAILLLLAIAIPIFKASERFWFRQDRMMKLDVHGPGWSHYESKVAAQMGKELRELLDFP